MADNDPDRGRYVFGSNDDHEGNVWISTEPSGQEIEHLRGEPIYFNLRAGTTLKEAEQLAETLNNLVDNIYIAKPINLNSR